MRERVLGIIIAAGRGSRLGDLTRKKPKCCVDICGRTLVEWHFENFVKHQIVDVVVTLGYKAAYGSRLVGELADKYGLKVEVVVLSDWASVNSAESLRRALDGRCQERFVVVYGDCVYGPDFFSSATSPGSAEITVPYDPNWQSYWLLREEDIHEDAESFIFDAGDRLTEIGQSVRARPLPKGQFAGMLLLTHEGAQAILTASAFGQSGNLDTTGLLSALIAEGAAIHVQPAFGAWAEIDTLGDVAIAEDRLRQHRR